MIGNSVMKELIKQFLKYSVVFFFDLWKSEKIVKVVFKRANILLIMSHHFWYVDNGLSL